MYYNIKDFFTDNKFNIYNILFFIFIIIIILSKGITFSKLLIIYFLFIVNQIIILYKNKIPNDHTIKYDNLDDIKKKMKETILERGKLINSKKMSLDEWVKYNTENVVEKIDNKDFYIFIFEYINHQDDFLTLVHANKGYINLVWKDVMKDQKENFPFIKEETNDKLINNMYELGQFDKINTIKYYWTDPLEKTLIKKESFFMKWYDKNNKKSGVIGMGYNTNNILETNTISYSQYIHYIYLFIIDFIILAIAYITYFVSNHKIKSVVLLVFSSIYIINYINSRELVGSFTTENIKTQNINSSILGISFLIGVNIFILTSLKQEIKVKLFIESGLIFSISLILLLFSMFKVTNFMNIHELMEDRISNQMIFNFSIFLNIIVIINYILYVISRSKHFLTNII